MINDDNELMIRLSENDLTRKIISQNILDTKYSRFTVLQSDWSLPGIYV